MWNRSSESSSLRTSRPSAPASTCAGRAKRRRLPPLPRGSWAFRRGTGPRASLVRWPPGPAPSRRQKTSVFFTAHSPPTRVIAEGDPYPDQVHESATDIACLLGLDVIDDLDWGVAWQSAGRKADSWLGV